MKTDKIWTWLKSFAEMLSPRAMQRHAHLVDLENYHATRSASVQPRYDLQKFGGSLTRPLMISIDALLVTEEMPE